MTTPEPGDRVRVRKDRDDYLKVTGDRSPAGEVSIVSPDPEHGAIVAVRFKDGGGAQYPVDAVERA
jgi:membrane carboxypeptidase/penicillin-binding protein